MKKDFDVKMKRFSDDIDVAHKILDIRTEVEELSMRLVAQCRFKEANELLSSLDQSDKYLRMMMESWKSL